MMMILSTYQQLQVLNECQFVVETLFPANEVFPEFWFGPKRPKTFCKLTHPNTSSGITPAIAIAQCAINRHDTVRKLQTPFCGDWGLYGLMLTTKCSTSRPGGNDKTVESAFLYQKYCDHRRRFKVKILDENNVQRVNISFGIRFRRRFTTGLGLWFSNSSWKLGHC